MTTQSTSKTLLITGATGGMGRACALLAAERGYNLLLTDLNEARLKIIADECRQFGVDVHFNALDIANSSAIKTFVDDLKTRDGIHAVIHTAGVSPQMASWEKIVQVDLIGTVELLESLKSLIKPGGCAVGIASMSGHMIPPNPSIDSLLADPLSEGLIERLASLPNTPFSNPGFAYAYAKRALINYVANHAMSWGLEGKRLVSLSPGLIETDMGKLEANADAENHAARRSLIALRREGLPQEIAKAALFLVSDDASYISGCDLLVDGGFVGSFSKFARSKQVAN